MPFPAITKVTNYTIQQCRHDSRENPERVRKWKEADLNYDNLMFNHKTKRDRKVPLRQLYPGKEGGLSVFLDADLSEYFCTNEG